LGATCTIAALAEGDTATMTVRSRAVRAGTTSLSATADALQPDPDASNDTATRSTTIEPRPGAVTSSASDVVARSAVLHGVVAPAGTQTTTRFEYGPTAAYGTSTPAVAAGPGTQSRAVSATLAGLEPETTYHYRLVVENAEGATVRGADRTFTTAAVTATPEPKVVEVERRVEVERLVEVVRTVLVGGGSAPAPAADRTAPALSGLACPGGACACGCPRRQPPRRPSRCAAPDASAAQGGPARSSAGIPVRTLTVRATGPGEVGGRLSRLRPGRYRVTAVATDVAGNASRAQTIERTLR
jgi:hypothetical protein